VIEGRPDLAGTTLVLCSADESAVYLEAYDQRTKVGIWRCAEVGFYARRCGKKRCSWVGLDDRLMLQYHDPEWGVPVHDDRKHFEFLVLEGAQAGLSWTIVLKKREGYRCAFDRFDPERVARFSARRIEKLALDPGIIRNRMKIGGMCSK
jgi:Methyladenine glycosylase